jgi:hypothetical protein
MTLSGVVLLAVLGQMPAQDKESVAASAEPTIENDWVRAAHGGDHRACSHLGDASQDRTRRCLFAAAQDKSVNNAAVDFPADHVHEYRRREPHRKRVCTKHQVGAENRAPFFGSLDRIVREAAVLNGGCVRPG